MLDSNYSDEEVNEDEHTEGPSIILYSTGRKYIRIHLLEKMLCIQTISLNFWLLKVYEYNYSVLSIGKESNSYHL